MTNSDGAALHRALGLTDDEADRIAEILGHPPNHLELAMYAVMWSEHCSYKSSRLHLRRLPTDAPQVLVGPGENAGVVDVGDGIAVAWDGGIASAHALTAAMPYLKCAKAVEFLMVQRPGTDPVDSSEPREYLMLNGLSSTERAIDAAQRPIGESLLEGASAGNADLLVLGGYGHSRLRQLFSGGVTKHVVSYADMPLFLVH